MTPEREKLIRDHWRKTRGWPTECDVLRVPVLMPPTPVMERYPLDLNIRDRIDTLDFRREYGTYEGRGAMRVICEGVVVEQTLL